MNFNEELKKRVETIDKILEVFKPKEEGLQIEVIKAMNYSLNAGGKRIRPILLLETMRLFNEQINDYSSIIDSETKVKYFLSAIEMIHTYSLVHDDLPAMDNDELRRGKPTTHIKFGHAMGVLAGDGLLNYAFELGLQAVVESLDKSSASNALLLLSKKAGIYGMIGGQTVDVNLSGLNNKYNNKETLEFIYELKTGALIEAAMGIGAILSNATKEETKKCIKAGSLIGMAFQIQDDILDITSTNEVLGKPIGSDAKNQKNTYVTLFGLEKAKKDVQEFSKEAISIIESLPCKNEFLVELINFLIYRKK